LGGGTRAGQASRKRDRGLGARLVGRGVRGRRLALRTTNELSDGRLERLGVDEVSLPDDGPANRGGELASGRIAFVALRAQRFEDDLLELPWNVRRVAGRGLDDRRPNDVEQGLASQAPVDGAPGEDFPEDNAECVEVASSIERFAARLLGGHISELPLEDSLLFGEETRARDPEVGDLDGPLERQEDVLWAHIPVDDLERLTRLVSLFVSVVKPFRCLGDDPCADPAGDRRSLRFRRGHQAAEVASFDVFHGEEEALVTEILEFVHLDDVRMIQARREASLLDEHGAEASRSAVSGKNSLEDEDLERALGTTLLRQKDLGHAAGAQATHDLELGDVLRRRGRFVHPRGTGG
jgi:hypothetical protein